MMVLSILHTIEVSCCATFKQDPQGSNQEIRYRGQMTSLASMEVALMMMRYTIANFRCSVTRSLANGEEQTLRDEKKCKMYPHDASVVSTGFIVLTKTLGSKHTKKQTDTYKLLTSSSSSSMTENNIYHKQLHATFTYVKVCASNDIAFLSPNPC